MTPPQRFSALIEDFLGPSNADRPPILADDCLLDIAARTFHLGLTPDGGSVAISTVVYLADGDPEQVLPDLIAEFNAFYLFRGGYRLSVDPATQSLYVSVNKSLAGLEGEDLDAFFDDLIERCAACTAWYMDELERGGAPGETPETAVAV